MSDPTESNPYAASFPPHRWNKRLAVYEIVFTGGQILDERFNLAAQARAVADALDASETGEVPFGPAPGDRFWVRITTTRDFLRDCGFPLDRYLRDRCREAYETCPRPA